MKQGTSRLKDYLQSVYSWAKKAFPILVNLLTELKDKYSVLLGHIKHFPMITFSITTWTILCKYILENKAGKIVDDHCRIVITGFKEGHAQKNGTENIRYKV